MKQLLGDCYRLIQPLFDPLRMIRNLVAYPYYVRDALSYRGLPGSEARAQWRYRPILDDWTATTDFDSHYVYLGAWVFRQITTRHPKQHVDVGSQISWVTCLASVTEVVFIDIRPFSGVVPNLTSVAGSVLAMPYPDRTLRSVSCLHVAEHIGLGRYGDPLNPLGTRQAIKELSRVLAPSGHLYFALPVGKPRVFFNAHRVHSPTDIVQWFTEEGLSLLEFAAVDDSGSFHAIAIPQDLCSADYGCGMFLLTRQ
jgi:SAM-dependent methyltransferase